MASEAVMDALKAFAKTLQDQTLTTLARKKPFHVAVARSGLEWTPPVHRQAQHLRYLPQIAIH